MANTLDNLGIVFAHGQTETTGLLPTAEKPRTAFISAPVTVDTGLLREMLQKRGIASYELDEVLAEGRTIPELLEDCLQRADLVVAVMGGGDRENVFFELGYALALKKRVLVLLPPGESMPIWLSATPYLRAGPHNREAIEFGLDQILSAPSGGRRHEGESAQKTKPIGPLADQLLEELAELPKPADERQLAEIVRAALDASGASSFEPEVQTADIRPDFAVWSDDFEPWLGNPLLIEVTSGFASPAKVEQLLRYLDYTKGTWGLLLYCGDSSSPAVKPTQHPRILVVSIERFLESLRDTSLGTWLYQLRNMRVHGRG